MSLDCSITYCGKISVLRLYFTHHLLFQISHDTTISQGFFGFGDFLLLVVLFNGQSQPSQMHCL